jgi:hypothetical protein
MAGAAGMSPADLVNAMREGGLIAADAAAAPDVPESRPWFISLLLGLAGWLAGMFVLVFVALLFNVDSSSHLVVIGIVLLTIAWLLYSRARDLVFLEQLTLAFSIAGQVAVAVFLAEELDKPVPTFAALLGLQLVVFVAMPDRVARTIATFFGSLAWVWLVRFALRPGEGRRFFFDPGAEFTFPVFGAWTLPIEWLLTWAPMIALLAWLIRTEPRWMARRAGDFARPAVTGLMLGLALGGIGAEPENSLTLGLAGVGREFSGWALFPLLSIALAMYAAFCAHQVRSTWLSGVAVVASLVHLGRFYYLYGTTLTWKSLTMLLTGAALLTAAALISKRVGEARP